MIRTKCAIVAFCLCLPLFSLKVPPAAAQPDATRTQQGSDSPRDRPIKDKWGLVVGISKFKKPELKLQSAAKDATDFYNFLVNEEHFAPDHVMLLTDEQATRANILYLLGDKWLPRLANPDDLVVLYFSSHGSSSDLDVGGVNYLVAYDTDPENLFASGLPMQDLVRLIKTRVHSNRVVLMLDACHSGAADPSEKGITRVANVDADEMVQGTGQLVISSSLPNQRSWECASTPNSVFTKHLVAALRKNGDATTLGTAFDLLRDKVQEQVLRERGVLQTPVLKSKWEGKDLILAAAATDPRPGLAVSLPESLKPAEERSPTSMLPKDVPKVWHSHEKGAWGTHDGTWTFNEATQEFDVTFAHNDSYADSRSAKLKLIEFSNGRVFLSGRFRWVNAGQGQKYSIEGVRQGNKIIGTATYEQLGLKSRGTWEASW